MKYFLSLLLISSIATVLANPADSQTFCSTIGVQNTVNNVQNFYKTGKPKLDPVTNLLYATQGLNQLADAQPGIMLTPEFQKTYVDFLKKVESTQITDAEIKKYQAQMAQDFINGRPDYMKKCQAIFSKEFPKCKVALNAKEVTPAQNICLTKMMNHITPLIAAAVPDVFKDSTGAADADRDIATAIKQQKDFKTITGLIEKRMTFQSHSKAFLPLIFKNLIEVNHVAYRDQVFKLVDALAARETLKAAFKDKLSVMRSSIKHKDLGYFKLLIKESWLTKEEMKKFAAEVKDPAAKKLLI